MKVDKAKDLVGIVAFSSESSESTMMAELDEDPGRVEGGKSLKTESESDIVGSNVEEDLRSIGCFKKGDK